VRREPHPLAILGRRPIVRRHHRILTAIAASGALALTLIVVGGAFAPRPPAPRPQAFLPQDATTIAAPADTLTAGIARAQQRLREVPGDYLTWAGLGTAYLEKARATGDASFYPLAEGALRESLRRREGNATALIGLGALANARHDFGTARDFARRAIAENSYSAEAQGVLTDAETQLGHRKAATAAVQRMLDLRPGLPAYTRAAYDLEQRGRIADARALLQRALADAVDPSTVAYCRAQLGDLAWHAGDLATAAQEYSAGREADPSYSPLLLGMARVTAAQGRTSASLAAFADLTHRSPAPSNLIEYAEQLRAAGRSGDARTQLDLAADALKLIAANGGRDDLAVAQLAIAHVPLGLAAPAEAVAPAHREWQRRQHVDVADTLAWALHLAGRDGEALRYARLAVGPGAHNAGYAYHLGVIELGLGHRDAARTWLARAMDINPYFSPVDAPRAASILIGLRTP
jgi:tetratricopeptide (TPR) repeat protein